MHGVSARLYSKFGWRSLPIQTRARPRAVVIETLGHVDAPDLQSAGQMLDERGEERVPVTAAVPSVMA